MREHRILRAIPFILLAIITLGMSLVGYDGYKRSHVKPKPSPMTPATTTVTSVVTATGQDGHPCKLLDSGWWACGDPNTVWFQCNAGMFVTDFKYCPESRMLDRKGTHD